MFSLPNNEVDYDHIQPTDYEGKLSVIYMRRDNILMELWEMENYKEKVWSKRHMIDVEPLREKEPHSIPLMFYNADIALMSGFYGVLFFKFKNGMVRLEEQIQTLGIVLFKSDFEPCNLKTCFCRRCMRETNEEEVNQS
ncbi:hypothetical protein JCGZ_07462 [Jatropha curcas]|uniref:Uncharacterized protein n=1 Tax=Jatropha curcas TaxID=180498 RepID=A0A067KCE6_JATCU|nr:hypothetical protein JCGZ_07462 [Jatropha curcas]